METANLSERRVQAAEASGGISSHVIYDRIIEIASHLQGSVIDFGAGIGNLTRRLWELNRFQGIWGADIMDRPSDLPQEIYWHHLDLNHPYLLPPASYDVVISVEVIEHLENPRDIAREWHRMMKPGGTLIISTPNNESIRSLVALLVRGHFASFSDANYPAHITALVCKDLVRILTEAGFSDVSFRWTDEGGIPKMPSVTWQKASLGLLKGRRFSDNVIATAIKPR